jgi:hypothetical protein
VSHPLSSPARRRRGKGIKAPDVVLDSLPLRFAPAGNDSGDGFAPGGNDSLADSHYLARASSPPGIGLGTPVVVGRLRGRPFTERTAR